MSATERKVELLFYIFIWCVVCVYIVSVHTLAMVHVEVGRQLTGMGPLFPPLSPLDKIQEVRLGGKHICLLSLLTSPRTFVESLCVS